MNIGMKAFLAAGLLAGAIGFSSAGAQAMPATPDPAVAMGGDLSMQVENVRWCGGPRCGWRHHRRHHHRRWRY